MKNTTLKSNHKRLMLMGAAIGAMSLVVTPVYGQVATDAPIETTTTNPDGTTTDEVIVTGSRIKRDGYDAPSPVSVLDKKLIEESGFTDLGEVLQRAPAVAVGQGLSNAQTSGLDAGATFANLRGLGSHRTLTLINGRRRVPGDFTSSSVDLSSIPTSMVERTEIVTGGTSAVYGADAVTGVINVILKKNFEGLTLEGSAGMPSAGGGGSAQRISLSYGKNFSDNAGKGGNISFAGNYYNSELLMASDRDFSSGNNFIEFQTNVPGETFDGVTPQFTVRQNPTTFLYGEQGMFWLWNGAATPEYPGGHYSYHTVDPELRELTNDAPPHTNYWNGIQGNGWATGGDGFNFAKYGQLRGGYEAFNGMVNLNYEVTDNAEFYANFDLTSSQTESPGQPSFHPAGGDNLYVYRDNPYLSADMQNLMDSRGLGWLWIWRTHDDLGVRNTFVDRLNYTGVAGLKGNFSNGWDYEVFGQYGAMNIDTKTKNTMIAANYLNAINVVDNGNGPECRSAAARAAGCLPLRVLGRNDNISQATRDYVLHDFETSLDLTQSMFGGQITGDLYELPAGNVAFAAGVEHRKETLHYLDDPRNSAGEILLNSPTPETKGDVSVSEAFAELSVPLAADRPLINSLALEGAVRLSDYSNSGLSTTWKLGGTWEPVDSLKFRVTRSLSVRAPTITDLYSPGITSFAAIIDPCDETTLLALVDQTQAMNRRANCAALGLSVNGTPGNNYNDPQPTVTKQVLTGGNEDLATEDSLSWTIGGIFTPSFIDGLRMSVDYWDIDMENVISSQGAQDILNNCVDSASIDNDFCALVTRGPIDPNVVSSGAVTSIRDFKINVDKRRAKGIDTQLNYSISPDFVPGSFDLYGAATLLMDYDIINVNPLGDFATDEVGEVRGTPLPKWRGNVSVAYEQGPVRVSWFGNYIHSMELSKNEAAGTYQPGYDSVDSVFYHYLYGKYDINDKFMIQGGVNNVLDKAPPATPYTFMGAGGLYDNNGRYFWIGGKARF